MPAKKKTASAPPVLPADEVIAPAKKVRAPRKAKAATTPVAAPVEVVVAALPVAAPKPAKPARRRQDSVESLVRRLSESLTEIKGYDAFANEQWSRMRQAEKKGNRAELIRVIGQTSAFKRRLYAISDATSIWGEALDTAVQFVQAEDKANRHGQRQFDSGLRADFADMKTRVDRLVFVKDEELADAKVQVKKDLESLIFRTQNFSWPHGFCKCGQPLVETTLKDGKKKVFPRCKDCFIKAKSTLASLDDTFEPKKRIVKKPGSASKRHTDGKTGSNRGNRSAEDGKRGRGGEKKGRLSVDQN